MGKYYDFANTVELAEYMDSTSHYLGQELARTVGDAPPKGVTVHVHSITGELLVARWNWIIGAGGKPQPYQAAAFMNHAEAWREYEIEALWLLGR